MCAMRSVSFLSPNVNYEMTLGDGGMREMKRGGRAVGRGEVLSWTTEPRYTESSN